MPKTIPPRIRVIIPPDLQRHYRLLAQSSDALLSDVFCQAVQSFLTLREERIASGGTMLYLRSPSAGRNQLVQLDAKLHRELTLVCKKDGISVRGGLFNALTYARAGALP